nr:DUF3105 domain-containing protein [Micromonospora sp. DSM 115978]
MRTAAGRIAALALVASAVLGYTGYEAFVRSTSWPDRAARIDGVVDYRATRPEILTREHVRGPVDYPVTPPVGGDHDLTWQRCMGQVYDAPVVDERAVHSLEHGAVWLTYRPDLPMDQVGRLADRVRGRGYLMMSPYPGLTAPISLQAWGFQLQVDSVDDPRIEEFIVVLAGNGGMEFGASCTAGTIETAD